MKNIKRTSLVLTIFSLFLCLTTVAQAQGKATLINKYCPQTTKELQKRIKAVKNVYKGMHTDISSPLPASPIGRYNRHVNILVGNLGHQVKRMQELLVKVQGRKCQEIGQGLASHIQKLQETQTSIEAAVFDSNSKNYKKFVEILGTQVKGLSTKFKKH